MPEPAAPTATVSRALGDASALLAPHDSARLDAELLLAAVLGVSRTQLYLEPQRELDETALGAYRRLVVQRLDGVPLPYLTGECEFWSLRLSVDRAVLVPRPETELVVERALALSDAAASPAVIDLGTGSGAIAAAFAHERPRAQVVASDIAASSLAVARANFRRLGLGRVAVVTSDWLNAFNAECFDLVLANPPYIGVTEHATLDRELAHEPRRALFAANHGLAAIETIVMQARTRLRRGGHLVVEHGYQHAARVRALLTAAAYDAIETHTDLAGHERVTHARTPRAVR